ncbi:hypothetical protein EO244_06370 [Ancylomarina salipaludis]|uniref:Uncharacterized protein n=1 Tax=Ancylomarina salipaludis TaxID=2501299 RepID=A0A4Q1JN87_9BACT|nr:hypothetical protein [Ancylomarina salipaludis]RXQ95924.1 hypothetical protein EO244_06370 [Ancylomarina salipaludis]
MKTLFLTLSIMIFLTASLFSQLKYEGKLDAKYKSIKLDDGNLKFVKYNKKEQEVLIFNSDYSLWRTIDLPLPKQHLLDEIKYISQRTFNNDDSVELVYSCLVYSLYDDYEDPENESVKIEFTLNIINESGEIILKVPDSNDMEIIDFNGTKKLLIYKHPSKHFEENGETLIYTLPAD